MASNTSSIDELIILLEHIHTEETRIIVLIREARRRETTGGNTEVVPAIIENNSERDTTPTDFRIGDRVQIVNAVWGSRETTGVVTRVTPDRVYLIITGSGRATWRIRRNLRRI
jgi:hypothetical protein